MFELSNMPGITKTTLPRVFSCVNVVHIVPSIRNLSVFLPLSSCHVISEPADCLPTPFTNVVSIRTSLPSDY